MKKTLTLAVSVLLAGCAGIRSSVEYDVAAPEMYELELLASQMEAQGEMTAEDRKFLYTKQQMYSKGRRSAGKRLRREER